MADVILSPIVDLIIETLGSAAVQEVKSLYGARDELSKLEETLDTIRAVLADAEKRQIREEQVKIWLQKLEDVLNAADDLVDEVNTEGLRRQLMPGKKIRKKVRTFFSSDNQLVFRHKMAREIKTMRERLDAISADKDRFHFATLETDQVTRVRDDSHSFVDKENVVGRDKERRAIVELLLDHENRAHQEKVSVIPIVGMGGLGKTTLAQLVFNDERVQQHFALKLWVCVSDDFSSKVLCEKIIKIITAERVENLVLEQLQTKLREQINGKRFLLVLDDVWNEDPGKWQDFEGLLRANCAEESKIIVTARNDVVADIMGTVEPYYLGILNSEDSWELFERMAFHRRKKLTQPDTVDAAKKIVGKCKGLPLAIKMIGSTLLRSRNPEIDWPSFLENDLLNITQKEKGILSTLKLSYDYLPTHLKPCFAYCSLFPKDHEFDVQTLVTMWIAQGFIRSPNQNQNLEDVGYNYFMDLISRSFFQEAKIDELKRVTTCKMHDLVHDLATKVAGDKYAMLGSFKDDIPRKAVHVSFNVARCEKLGVPPSSWLQAKRLRSFLNPSEYNLECEEDHTTLILEHFRYLRMLSLDFSYMKKVPDSIGKLKHLRYLDISETRIVRLPTSITKLVNLQKLKLNYCRALRELPNEIHKLVNLKHLELNGCYSITHMPRGLGKLTELQTLSLFLLSENIPSSMTYNHGKLDELMGLNNLRGQLTIKGIRSGMETTVTKLREKKHLRSLYLDFKSRDDDASSSEQEWETTLEGLQPHTNLKELTLLNHGGATLSPLLPLLTNLVTLSLYNCSKCLQLPSLDKFHSLKKIQLVHLEALEYITINEGDYNFSTSSSLSISVLPSLQNLTLEELPNLRGWWRSDMVEYQVDQVVLPSFPRLSLLRIKRCPKLTSMPCYPNVGYLTLWETSWKHFEQTMLVRDPQAQISATTAAEQASPPSAASSSITRSNIVSSYPLSKLTSLFVHTVMDLEYFPDERMKGLASLKELYIMDCPALKYLSPWILYLTSLEDLFISNCKEFEGIKWPETPTLTRLRLLQLWGLPKLKYVFAPDSQCLTSLEELQICSCEGLEEIKLTPALPRLRVLILERLPQLKHLSSPGVQQHLTSLEKLQIESCEGLEEIKLTPALPRLRVLKLKRLRKLKHLSSPGVQQHLTSLEELEIDSCEELEEIKLTPRLRVLRLSRLPKLKHLSSPGVQQHLTSIEELDITNCEELQVSNDDSIEWQALTTLRFLDFTSLPQLVSLPGGLQFLTTLKELQIWHCHNFTGLPDWICKLSSLETLDIVQCYEFKSVPGSISSLTSLQKLFINGKFMNPREIHEDLDLSCSASGTGPSSWKNLNKFRGLQLCNK